MYQKSNYDMPFCGLSVRIKPTGKQAPKYEFSADASKVKYTCSITKRKFTLSQVNEWFMTPEVQKYHNAGYVLKEIWLKHKKYKIHTNTIKVLLN